MRQGVFLAIFAISTLAATFFIYNIPSVVEIKKAASTNITEIYNQWKAKYKLNIGSAEDDLRLKIFTENYEYITNHNQKENIKYKLGLNPYSHLTLSEFSALYLGKTKTEAQNAPSVNNSETSNETQVAVPDSIDWEAQGKVSRVKDQGHCGSCWAFSASGAIESLLAINSGSVIEFSEQQLVDCAGSFGNNGCNGGDMFLAFEYVTANGIVQEKDYPYTGVDGNCSIPTGSSTFRISGYRNVTANSSQALKEAVAKNPVSVSVQADSKDFQMYETGVLTSEACGTNLDHGVLAVGYGNLNGTDFWKVKNSWGPKWGLNGYILIERIDGPGICGINMENTYPTHYC